MFTSENTQGYSEPELDALNSEWNGRVIENALEPGTPEYERAKKAFSDEVAQR